MPTAYWQKSFAQWHYGHWWQEAIRGKITAMTGLIIFLSIAALLTVALEHAHRRSAGRWTPGRDTRNDRDMARLGDDLRATAQREDVPEVPGDVLRFTGRRPILDPRLTDGRVGRTAA
jgi:hypothetical protein